MKKGLLIACLVMFTAVLYGAEPVFLTIDELAIYNGQNGNPSYVAVEGTIYDVTGVDNWKTGEHKGGKTGTDISALIKSAPHGNGILSKRTVVGSVVKPMTLAELAKFDGKNGNPAYVAVNGLVYDQTDIAAWKTGQHKGGKAGTDITKKIRKAPHGMKVFKDRKPVAKLVTEKKNK